VSKRSAFHFLCWVFLAPLVSLVLGGCASHLTKTPAQLEAAQTSESIAETESLERIRFDELIAWQLLDDQGLWIELNGPRRTYRLELMPSCSFALRQASGFRFSGKSASYISLGDQVVVGMDRCEIVGIYPTEGQREASASVTHKMN